MKICPSCGLKYADTDTRCLIDRAELTPMPDPYIGMVLKSRYTVEGPLGEGGMAVVYRARSTHVDRPVAVKIMNAHLKSDKALKERFRREAKNAAAVAHPNIVAITDHGETEDGVPFLIMELLDGETLNKQIERGPMKPGKVALLGLQIARGLARAHDFDVIHRDLKPENIFIAKDSKGELKIPKILDFGIARSMHDSRLTNAGEIFGTPQYMAPERVTTVDAGAPADLYSLGCIFFEMVTGRLPFESSDVPGFFIKHLQEAPPKPSSLVDGLPRELEELILAMLEKSPENRPVDAHAVVKELLALAPEQVADSGPPPPAPGASQPQIASPTLPPTTLERWAHRAVLFEQMLSTAFPGGNVPREQAGALGEIRSALKRLEELRGAGLKLQRQLEAMEANAKDGRERLGHAVQTLGEDLSAARETARAALRDVQPYLDSEAGAKRESEAAYAKFWASFPGEQLPERPTPELVETARDLANHLDRWQLTLGTAAKARTWVDAKEREVTDLQFQVDALRARLQTVETEYDAEREKVEATLQAQGDEAAKLETRLAELGGMFVEPLRERDELSGLFERLEGESSTAA